MKTIFLILTLAFSGCTTTGWTNNPHAWQALSDFAKPDQAPFTGAAPMRPIIYQNGK